VQRQEMADHLIVSAADDLLWAADEENGEDYRRIFDPAAGRHRTVTPAQYAATMLRVGSHWGETPEANIWARLHQTNVIVLIRTTQIDALDWTRPQTTHNSMQVYRALTPEEPNIYANPDAVGFTLTHFH
jgi:hypothetical protein